jgi:hypothetical protein
MGKLVQTLAGIDFQEKLKRRIGETSLLQEYDPLRGELVQTLAGKEFYEGI